MPVSPIRIPVTAAHIRQGEPRDANKCAIAQVMKSHFGAELLDVEVTRERVILDLQNEPDRIYWQNSPEVSAWIKTYDEDSGEPDKARGFNLSVEFNPHWGGEQGNCILISGG